MIFQTRGGKNAPAQFTTHRSANRGGMYKACHSTLCLGIDQSAQALGSGVSVTKIPSAFACKSLGRAGMGCCESRYSCFQQLGRGDTGESY